METNLPEKTQDKQLMSEVRKTSQILLKETENFYALPVTTFSEIRNSKSLSLVLLKKEVSELELIATLNIFIAELVYNFNVGKQMTAAQIAETSKSILGSDEFYYLKPEDFKACFSMARQGIFGKVYDAIDERVIFEWLREYCFRRASFFSSTGDQKQIEYKKDPIDYNAVKEWYKSNGKNYMERDKKESGEYHRYKVERMKAEQEGKINIEGNINPNPKGEIKNEER